MKRPAKSLIRKLTEACDAVGGIEKKGRNEFQKYNYVKAADVAKAFRHELFKRNVLLTSDEKEVTEKEVATNSGGTIRVLTLKVEYTLRDGDSDQTLTSTAFGVGMDNGDKALYKAKTGALKYFLRGIGIVPDEKDDPEFDESVDEQTDERLKEGYQPPPKKAKKRQPVKDFQVRAFHAATVTGKKTAEQIAVYLRTKFSVASVSELPADEFQTAIKWALGTEALADTLQTSIEAANHRKSNGAETETTPERRYEAV